MEDVKLSQEDLDELTKQFDSINEDGDGFLSLEELQHALEVCGVKLAGFEARAIVEKYDTSNDGKIDMAEFQQLYRNEVLKRNKGLQFKKNVSTRTGIRSHEGTSQASSSGTTHSVKDSELKAFSGWINTSLDEDPDCKKYLPLSGEDLCKKVGDGILLCKLLNKTNPDLIDERTINKSNLTVFRRHENLTLALGSAQSIGCSIVNIGAEDIEAGKIHLVLGLIWQIIRIGLLSDINLQHHPGLVLLAEEGEDLADLRKLSPEALLLRWVNYHLRKSGCQREIANFSEDIKDSEAYSYLLASIAPDDAEEKVTLAPLGFTDPEDRANAVLNEADKIKCRSFVTAKDIVAGNPKLNLAFVANLFNTYPSLDAKDLGEFEQGEDETREEKTYRNWMNSLGIQPFVNHLYSDLSSGVIIFKLYDTIRPGMVNWSKVIQKFHKMKLHFEKLENCNYAVDCARDIHLSVVNIGGEDIKDGNPTITLALVWQLMRAYTLKMLTELAGADNPIVDQEIITWANTKLAGAAKFKSFTDPALADGRIILMLIDKIRAGIVKWDLVNQTDITPERSLANAKYAISLARKIGARVYALPDDIVEVKKNMVMTVFACLMTLDNPYKRERQEQQVKNAAQGPMLDGLQ